MKSFTSTSFAHMRVHDRSAYKMTILFNPWQQHEGREEEEEAVGSTDRSDDAAVGGTDRSDDAAVGGTDRSDDAAVGGTHHHTRQPESPPAPVHTPATAAALEPEMVLVEHTAQMMMNGRIGGSIDNAGMCSGQNKIRQLRLLHVDTNEEEGNTSVAAAPTNEEYAYTEDDTIMSIGDEFSQGSRTPGPVTPISFPRTPLPSPTATTTSHATPTFTTNNEGEDDDEEVIGWGGRTGEDYSFSNDSRQHTDSPGIMAMENSTSFSFQKLPPPPTLLRRAPPQQHRTDMPFSTVPAASLLPEEAGQHETAFLPFLPDNYGMPAPSPSLNRPAQATSQPLCSMCVRPCATEHFQCEPCAPHAPSARLCAECVMSWILEHAWISDDVRVLLSQPGGNPAQLEVLTPLLVQGRDARSNLETLDFATPYTPRRCACGEPTCPGSKTWLIYSDRSYPPVSLPPPMDAAAAAPSPFPQQSYLYRLLRGRQVPAKFAASGQQTAFSIVYQQLRDRWIPIIRWSQMSASVRALHRLHWCACSAVTLVKGRPSMNGGRPTVPAVSHCAGCDQLSCHCGARGHASSSLPAASSSSSYFSPSILGREHAHHGPSARMVETFGIGGIFTRLPHNWQLEPRHAGRYSQYASTLVEEFNDVLQTAQCASCPECGFTGIALPDNGDLDVQCSQCARRFCFFCGDGFVRDHGEFLRHPAVQRPGAVSADHMGLFDLPFGHVAWMSPSCASSSSPSSSSSSSRFGGGHWGVADVDNHFAHIHTQCHYNEEGGKQHGEDASTRWCHRNVQSYFPELPLVEARVRFLRVFVFQRFNLMLRGHGAQSSPLTIARATPAPYSDCLISREEFVVPALHLSNANFLCQPFAFPPLETYSHLVQAIRDGTQVDRVAFLAAAAPEVPLAPLKQPRRNPSPVLAPVPAPPPQRPSQPKPTVHSSSIPRTTTTILTNQPTPPAKTNSMAPVKTPAPNPYSNAFGAPSERAAASSSSAFGAFGSAIQSSSSSSAFGNALPMYATAFGTPSSSTSSSSTPFGNNKPFGTPSNSTPSNSTPSNSTPSNSTPFGNNPF